jgi:hypothetical protein
VKEQLRGSDAAELFFRHHSRMPVPWLQIVQLVPSILDVSRELMKRTKQVPPSAQLPLAATDEELAARVVSLEENERRQAELVAQMAEQLAGVARAVTDLHRRILWLTAISAVAAILAIAALVVAL